MGMDGEMEFLSTRTVRITPEILSLIAEIDEFKRAWRAPAVTQSRIISRHS
jgi:hypothetical protein